MKAKAASLLVVLLIATTQLMAQKRITVEATSYDISYNLDLKAVASIFGESRDLEEFEMRLNDYDSGISNLDLNDDGEVDYLRVIETYEKKVHVIVIQAVLDRDIFQDVATIVVEKKSNRVTYVQIIGDPFMYGSNYIIEPIYYHRPVIFSFFWARRYRSWVSPYYWGYYPTYYRYRRPYEVNIYLNNVYTRINHRHTYRYTDTRRNDYSVKLQSQISRNDYSRKHPERNFSTRNENVRNKHDFQTSRPDNNRTGNRPNVQNNESNRRSYDNSGTNSRYESGSRNQGNTINTRPAEGTRHEGTRMNERNPGQQNNAPVVTPRNPATNQSRPAPHTNRETYQTRPSTNTNSGTYQNRPSTNTNSGRYQSRPSTNSSNSGTYQSRPSTNTNRETNQARPSTPSRPEPRQVERKPAESSRNNDSKSDTKTETRSSSSSNRR